MATEYEVKIDQAVDTTEPSGTEIDLGQPVDPKSGSEISIEEAAGAKITTIDVTPEEAPLELKTS